MNVVNYLKSLRAARRQQKIVATDGVFDDGKHRSAAIGIKRVPGGKINRVGVIYRPPGRKPLADVALRECRQIRNLLAARVDNFQKSSLFDGDPDAGLRFEMITVNQIFHFSFFIFRSAELRRSFGGFRGEDTLLF